jgi:TolB-like protein/tetratricopeptide (TPR) repeat protein
MAWWRPWQPAAESGQSPGGVAVPADRPSLVVLPFDNLSDDKEQGYLADGITEDLTTDLARIPGLFVISRNAAFTYKDKAMQPAQVGGQLKVRYMLEGSIRRIGDDLRINAQLIDTSSGGHLWAERFDGDWSEVFSLQEQVVGKVAAALKLRLISGPRTAETPGATTVPAAYDLYLQAYALDYGKYPAEVASLLRQAVALDPNFGQAWAELAWVYWLNQSIDAAEKALATPHSKMAGEIKALLHEAEKHPSSSYYQIMADLQLWQRNWDEAVINAGRAIALNPSDQYGYEEMSLALVFDGRPADAKDYFDAATRVDPQPRAYRHLLAGLIAFSLEQFDSAIASLAKATPQELPTDHIRRQRLWLLAAAHAYLGHKEQAESTRKELETLTENATAFLAMGNLPFKRPADIERLRAGIIKAHLPDFPFGLVSENQLPAEEIRPLVFGHELRGREVDSGEPYSRITTSDGIAHISIGTSYSSDGVSRIDGNYVCTLFEVESDVQCAAIFRNPGGTPERQNEYVWATPWIHVFFSRVK